MHGLHDSAWAQRLRADRERARRDAQRLADERPNDVVASALDPIAYDQVTADVDSASPQPRPTFMTANVSAGRPPVAPPVNVVQEPAVAPLATDERPVPGDDGPPPPAEAMAPVVPTPLPNVTAVPEAAPMPREMTTGSLLNHRYVLGRELGVGGSSLIFQAEDRRRIGAEDFGLKIAIKVLRPEMRHNSNALTRLKREFRQMQRLTHPGIARVFELARDEDIWFMAMELIDGQTIHQWLKSTTRRPAAMQIIAGCCDALAHAHEAGVVHGDLKPSNVLVLADGSVKLVDFGSAAERDAATGEIDQERSFAATPPYASPQVLAGEIADPRDDVFSLACLAYAVLTHGEHPFDRKSSAEAQRAQMKPAYSRALLPRQFEVIVRALAWDRDQRPTSVREFWHALLASDLRREPGNHVSLPDAPSRPIPSTPTRDAPTVAAAPSEPARNAPSPSESASAAPSWESPPKRERTVSPEDMARLKSVLAAAEAHAERIVPTEPRQQKSTNEALGKFRGYVAGPLAHAEEENSIDGTPAAVDDTESASQHEPSKTTKRVWPWQRSAWVLAISLIASGAILGTQRHREPNTNAKVGTVTSQPRVQSSPPPIVVAAAPATGSIPSVTEKKSPQTVAKAAAPTAAPAEVSFATRTLHVGVGQTMAALSVKRVRSLGKARVAWTIEGGTARAGVDYQVADVQYIDFLEGQSVRSLFIPLIPEKDVGEARTSRTFTVKLQPVTGGLRLGEIKQVYVTIVGDVAEQRVARTDAS